MHYIKQFVRITVISAVLQVMTSGQGEDAVFSKDRIFRFEVVETERMTEQEALERHRDAIGMNVRIRLRLSTQGRGGYFYTFQSWAIPVGYAVRLTDQGPRWLYGSDSERGLADSPGPEGATGGHLESWVFLPRYSAVEYDVYDIALSRGEIHASTVFVRESEKDGIQELITKGYRVP